MRSFLSIFIFALAVAAQSAASTAGVGSFEAKNAEAREAFKDGKFEQALRLSREALEIGNRTLGQSSPEVAVVHSNLGVLYRSKQRYQDAMRSFEESLRIFEKLGKPHVREVIATHEAMGVTNRMAGRNADAERQFLKAIEIAQANFGADSIEMYSPTLALARHLSSNGNIREGDEFFIKAYRIAYLRKGRKAPELEAIRDTRTCIVVPQDPDGVKGAGFAADLDALRKSLGEPDPGPRRTLSVGVINGKAISLPKPSYPATMSSNRKIGAVVVRVLIDTDGKVLEARATCGHPDFAKSSVKAAFNAKFSPTFLSGEPVRVSGVIVYNFLGR